MAAEAANGSLLRCWTPTTTRQLLQDTVSSSSSCAFDVMDHVMEQDDGPSFVGALSKELKPWLSSLKPARTKGDAQAAEILSLLQGRALLNAETEATTSRGDSSIFIPRQVRSEQVEKFASNFPFLSNLISSVEATAQRELQPSIELDYSLTSVQLAVYPGDGTSGYPRHCDQSKSCDKEGMQRIITAVYYVTPHDWNETLDGGSLRVYYKNDACLESSSSPNNGNTTSSSSSSNDSYYDVVPYSNRMIVFRSDIVDHQVMPSLRRPRTAITIWLYGKVKSGGVSTTSPSPMMQTIRPVPSQGEPALQAADGGGGGGVVVSNDRDEITSLPPALSVSAQDSADEDATIFVSIAAYRDSELGPTLRSLFGTAQNPNRVSCGVVLQLDEVADQALFESLPREKEWFTTNVKILQLEARHAKGPCYARALCRQLHDGETFVLQIDSHMRFRPNWDTYLISQISKCPVPLKSMLTTYPVGYALPNVISNNETRGTLLVPWKFDADGMLRQRGRLLVGDTTRTDNVQCHLYAAGFNFSFASAMTNVPYDGNLQYLFFGEELSMAVRLFTHGYDLYAPAETVVYHLWSRSHRPTPIQEQISEETKRRREARRAEARQVVMQQLRGEGQGLGRERTAQEFATAVGVNFQEQTIDADAALGGLQASDFAINSSTLAPDSFEGQVTSLDAKVQARIASFLSAMNS